MISLAITAVIALAADAAAIPPAPVRWVEDHAGFLSPAARDTLDRRLEGYQRDTGHQVVVWIGDTIGGAALDDWAVRTFAAWQVGRRGIDDGVVMFVLANDRAIDIEVGYGLEGIVTDARASRIIREIMTPRLQAGDRDGAITAGADELLAAIEGKPWTGDPAARQQPQQAPPSPIELGFMALVAIGVVILLVKNPRLALMLLWTVGRGVGGFGGRNGGGGGGGFRGGGGRSGGGGARGHW